MPHNFDEILNLKKLINKILIKLFRVSINEFLFL